jgi:hypothetical protein
MTGRFDPNAADRRWQARWEEARSFVADSDSNKPKTYVLEMFPYPSGRIHMGHVRNYTMGDVIARYRRMQGHEVLHPMGWDAFGMPAENAAMERKVHPGEWTWENIRAMRDQLKRIGFALDWTREFATCEPAYYGQEQALFLELFDARLVPPRRHSAMNSAALGSLAATPRETGWSAATATKLAPKIVSGRVVNTSMESIESTGAARRKLKSSPLLLPIQFSCIRRTFSGQLSSVSRPSSRSSAKSVIFRNHCASLRRSTGAPERQPRPSITCSLASTVMSTGSQLTSLSLR